MAHPKRKSSKSKKRLRRTHVKITAAPTFEECDNCGSAKMLHRACPTCGYYRGRQVVARSEFA